MSGRSVGDLASCESGTTIDLDAYLARVGLRADVVRIRPSLEALHEAHLAAIPFENIDVRLGRTIALDLESLQRKLVRGGRGGYCFEQNTLFAAVLQELGFTVGTLEARVRPPGAAVVLPRTHMTLMVDWEGREYLADVGFGGLGPLLPVPVDGTVSEQPGGGYAVVQEAGMLVLRHRWRGEWRDLYAFSRTPALPVDFEVANHFTSTYPRSPFVNVLTVQRSSPAGRHILRGLTYSIRVGEEETVREITAEELPSLLRRQFALDLPDEEARLALVDV